MSKRSRLKPQTSAGRQNRPAVSLGLGIALLLLGAGGILGLRAYDRAEVFPVAVFGLFGVVGVLFLGEAIRRGMAGSRLAPPILEVESSSLKLGQTIDVWLTQPVRRSTDIDQVELSLTCREEATYHQAGDPKQAEHEKVCARHVSDSLDRFPEDDLELVAELRVPVDAVPSFTSRHNHVRWFISLRVSIPRWPDYTEHFPVRVAPIRVAESVPGGAA